MSLWVWVRVSTCQGHLIGHPVNGQHSLGAIVAGLYEELLWRCVPGRTKAAFRASPTTCKRALSSLVFKMETPHFPHTTQERAVNNTPFTPLRLRPCLKPEED